MSKNLQPSPLVTFCAEASLPTRYGDFRLLGYRSLSDEHEYGVVVHGEVRGANGVPVRLHSECFTGDVMGSNRCDCRDQLEASLRFIGRSESGVVVYLPQEGRGIGLINKIRAYGLQDEGLDTVEANHALGYPDDLRKYDVAAAIIKALGIQSVFLLTNNPRKRDGLSRHGVRVDGIVPVRTPRNEHNAFYLETKKAKSGHLL